MALAPAAPSASHPGMARRVSSFSAYVAAAQGPPSAKTTIPDSPAFTRAPPSTVSKPSPLAWKRRKSSQRSWVELDEQRTRKPDGQVVDQGDQAWSDADHDGDEDGTITFDGGPSPGLLKGETLDPNGQPPPSHFPPPAASSGSGLAHKPFSFGSRRRSSAPKPPTPTLKVFPSATVAPARSTYTAPESPTRDESLAAERERRAADHRVKMALRKQEEDLEEIKLKNELRALERKVRHGLRGFQNRNDTVVPPVPALPTSSSNESGNPLGPSRSNEEDEFGTMPDGQEAGLAVPMGGRSRRMSTLSSQSKSYENHHVYVGAPSSYNSASSGSSSQDASSSSHPPVLPLNLPGTSIGSLTKARANRPPSLVLPLSDKFTALPQSKISPIGGPLVSPLSHLRNSYLATYTPFPPADDPPPIGTYTPTNRVSLLSSTGEGVSRPQYDRSAYDLPSPSISESSALGEVIDDYIHSSDDEDNRRSNSDSDDASDEDGAGPSLSRMRKTLGVPRYSKDSGVAGSRKSSVPFAFDPEEWRPTSFALPPLEEESSRSGTPTSPLPTTNTATTNRSAAPLRGQDFWSGEGPSAATFPRKMSRVEPQPGAESSWDTRPRSTGSRLGSRPRSGRSSKRSRGTRGGVAGEGSGEQQRVWSEVEREQQQGEKGDWATGEEEAREEEEEEWEGQEVLGWSRRLAHLTIIWPFAMLGLMVKIGITQLGSFAGNSVPALLWTQAIGCLIFGLGMGRQDEMRYLYPPLFTGFVVGFAETINTFSGWMVQTFLAFSNYEAYGRTRLEDAIDGLTLLSLTLLIAHASLSFGLHLSRLLPNLPLVHPPPRHTRSLDLFVTAVSLISYGVVLFAYLFFVNLREELSFPLVFAPAGAVVRYYALRANPRRGRMLGGRRGGLPWGTGVVNVLGSAVAGGLFVLERAGGRISLTGEQCNALGALSIGFAGTLTSLASLLYEARSRWRSSLWRWGYVLGTVALGQLVLVGIIGGVWWSGTVGMRQVCSPA